MSGLASTLLAVGLGSAAETRAQVPPAPIVVANSSGPPWTALTPAQQAALAPLRKDWQTIDAARKQKWLEIAARLPSMPFEERQRIQDRMTDWARMTPEERGRARLQFQEARQISPQERQARWDAYLALPDEERRALASSAKSVPRASRASVRDPAGESKLPPATASMQKNNNSVPGPAAQATAKTVAPTVVQARPGASTTLISKTATPPAHAQVGQPKIAAGQGKVDERTLLPKARPQSAASSASSAQ